MLANKDEGDIVVEQMDWFSSIYSMDHHCPQCK